MHFSKRHSQPKVGQPRISRDSADETHTIQSDIEGTERQLDFLTHQVPSDGGGFRRKVEDSSDSPFNPDQISSRIRMSRKRKLSPFPPTSQCYIRTYVAEILMHISALMRDITTKAEKSVYKNSLSFLEDFFSRCSKIFRVWENSEKDELEKKVFPSTVFVLSSSFRTNTGKKRVGKKDGAKDCEKGNFLDPRRRLLS